jgi:hypothetical protein
MLKKVGKKCFFLLALFLGCGSGTTSGSGWVAVGPIDARDQCGSNGGRFNLAVAVLAELWFTIPKVGGDFFFVAHINKALCLKGMEWL